MSHRPRILIADDHVVVAESLGVLLARWYEVVAVVDQLAQIVPTAQRLQPDAALLDYSFGAAGNCIPQIAPLLAAAPSCRVVVLTAHDSPALADTSVAAGASSFVSKTASPDELRLALELALRQDPADASRRRHVADLADEPRASRREPDGQVQGPFGVTPREAAVLLMMYSGMKQVDIAAALGVVPKTVEYYRYMVSKRLGITKLSLLLRWVAEYRVELERTAAAARNDDTVGTPEPA